MNPITDEPVVTAILALLASAFGLALAFGVHLTGLQIAAVSQFVQAALVIAFLVRAKVTPESRLPKPASTIIDATGATVPVPV